MIKALFAFVFLFFSVTTPTMARAGDVMEVSWFGPGCEGNPLWDGRPYKASDPTVAAHRTLPFGTRLRLVNPDNGRSILVMVQTRGPFVEGRDLDISKAAAERIGMLREGVKHLIVQQLR
ncbi:MAG TPA: septal ring lytic transglycosylase RlpA family protein [Candidatus Paceibacterota bacterium]